MEQLSHNQVIRIACGELAGLYRVIFDEPGRLLTVVVRIGDDPAGSPDVTREASAQGGSGLPTNRRPQPFRGALRWIDRRQLEELDDARDLIRVNIEPEAIYLIPIKSTCAAAQFERRRVVMAGFLDFSHLYESVIVHGGLGGLVRDAMRTAKASRHLVYKCWSLLCRYGIVESSLRPRLDRCGAPSVRRPCDPGGRKKAGRKTTEQRLAAKAGRPQEPKQPGMSSEWRAKILAADRRIPSPKPRMPERCDQIIGSHFVQTYRYDGDLLVKVDLGMGEYPNRQQIRRVLSIEYSRLERALEKTTQGHYARALRGAGGRSWRGVSGPGHTWAIDSTIGDIYLRSSLDRAWIVGRPIVYVIVDVWSTAVVGFYVCLEGPSWAMAKLALFSAAAAQAMVADLWGYTPVLGLNPEPTLVAALQCDRGEYLSRRASETARQLLPIMSYAAPRRPDWKGSVEVLHRIEKDMQYHFVPGAIDARRAEYELRRFRPDEAALTVRDYVHVLYEMFTEYNLTADRTSRLDGQMQAAVVFPSPAGLWHWGHEVGIGCRRHIPTSELISALLPACNARITRRGIQLGNRTYGGPEVERRKWIDVARNYGVSDLPIHYFPGTVAKIWTPDMDGTGMLELQLSDQSTASPELTFDEVTDAYAYALARRGDVEHQRTLLRLAARQRRKDIVNAASALTAEAVGRAPVATRTLTEARQMEIAANANPPASTGPDDGGPPAADAGDESYLEAMRAILGTMRDEENHDDGA